MSERPRDPQQAWRGAGALGEGEERDCKQGCTENCHENWAGNAVEGLAQRAEKDRERQHWHRESGKSSTAPPETTLFDL